MWVSPWGLGSRAEQGHKWGEEQGGQRGRRHHVLRAQILDQLLGKR